jgi:glycosyltransferase involved in cell wall biosynthesis
MADESVKVMILARQLNRYAGGSPLGPLVDRLERRGCVVQVVCLSAGGVPTDPPRVVELRALGNRWLRSFFLRNFWANSPLERPDLLHAIDDEMGDVVLALAETIGLPYYQTVSRFETIARGLRLSRRWCRGLIVTSLELHQALVDELGVPAERIAVVPPGLTPCPQPFGGTGPGKVPVIGTGGPLEEASGTMIFLEAARLVVDAGHDVEFVVASAGSQQIMLRHRALRLRIADRVTVADYPSFSSEFWSVLDVYCQPAVVPSTGRTLILALGHAIPCIATNVKGLTSLIDTGENGLLIPRLDPGALARAIDALLEDPVMARRLGSTALERARDRFDPEVESDRLAGLYQQAAFVRSV